VAASLRRELGVKVSLEEGDYGEFTVLADGVEVVRGGLLGFLGVLPSASRVRARVEEKLRRES